METPGETPKVDIRLSVMSVSEKIVWNSLGTPEFLKSESEMAFKCAGTVSRNKVVYPSSENI